MSDIQDQLQNLTKIRDIQDKVIVLRKELPTVYEGFLKKQTRVTIEKLVQAKVKFELPKLYIPEIEKIDISSIKKQPRMNIDEIYKHAEDIEQCLKYLSN